VEPEAKAQFEKLERLASELELKEALKVAHIRSILEKKKDQYYVIHFKLPRVEGNETSGDYGDIYYRRWTAGEVMDLYSHPVYQKSLAWGMVDGKVVEPELSREERQQLFELQNELIAKAMHPSSGITKELLLESGNWPFTQALFSFLRSRSGMDKAIVEDMDEFFRK
jgi:hypothetical protein